MYIVSKRYQIERLPDGGVSDVFFKICSATVLTLFFSIGRLRFDETHGLAMLYSLFCIYHLYFISAIPISRNNPTLGAISHFCNVAYSLGPILTITPPTPNFYFHTILLFLFVIHSRYPFHLSKTLVDLSFP